MIAANNSCRVVVVGDPYQAIYGFRGATRDSMNIIKSNLQSISRTPVLKLPLHTTRRCPHSHVKIARQIVDHLSALESASLGTWKFISYEDFEHDRYTITQSDLVLCRRNAPIVRLCYGLIQCEMPAAIIGEDSIAEDMLSLIGAETTSCDALLLSLKEYEKQECAIAIRRALWQRLPFIKDFYRCLSFLTERSNSIDDLTQLIKRIFPKTISDPNVIRCSSVHRAKGLEANRVWIVGTELFFMPPEAKLDIYDDPTGWSFAEERNLLYVALTRAKHELVLVGSEFNPKAGLNLQQQQTIPKEKDEDDLSETLNKLTLNKLK